MQVRKDRESRRQDVLARARKQQMEEDEVQRAIDLERSATAVAANIRAALDKHPGSNLTELEHIRLALGYEAGDTLCACL